MYQTTEEKVSKTFDCINNIKSRLSVKGKLSFSEIDNMTKTCHIDTNFVFGNMSFDNGLMIDYSKSEVSKV